jgi:hypothetical protein
MLRLTHVDFTLVEFALVDDAGSVLRPVVVHVGSGTDWRHAVRFPTMHTAGTESTGDLALDTEVRERAAEELVRLEAALRVTRKGWAAA